MQRHQISLTVQLFPQHTDFKLEVTLLGTPLQLVTNDCLHTVLNCVNSLFYDINEGVRARTA